MTISKSRTFTLKGNIVTWTVTPAGFNLAVDSSNGEKISMKELMRGDFPPVAECMVCGGK
jgi:hypothetical protein